MEDNRKNVILVDWDAPNDWAFRKAVEESSGQKWEVISSVSNRNHGGTVQKLIRYIKYFMTPLGIAIHKNKYSRVLAWQQFYGLILAFYFRLFRVKNAPDITVMTFIYKPKKSLMGGLYERFMRYIVTSGYIKKFMLIGLTQQPQKTPQTSDLLV